MKKVLAIGAGFLAAQTIDDFRLMTEEYPPYNLTEIGVVKGIGVDVLAEVLKDMGSSKTAKDIEVLPWARGYSIVQEEKNSMLFSMTITSARQGIFKFAGPVISDSQVLMVRKAAKTKIASDADLNKLKIGAVRDDIGQQLLVEKKVDAKALEIAADANALAKMLGNGRIDAWGRTAKRPPSTS